MTTLRKLTLLILILALGFLGLPGGKSLAAPPPIPPGQEGGRSPQDLINAVNALRIANGQNVLNAHPALMQVAQWEADVILAGAPGHTRPPGLTLGQQIMSYGYPLGGNIALDGYRSENWVGGSNMTVAEAITSWLGDAPHTNTMLSPNRTDIGAGVSVGQDQWGDPVYYYVIETAMQTSSGEMQYEALVFLTAMPQTQVAAYGDATQAAAALQMPQFMVPVSLATARPDGDVIHQVQYGQTLWSIAVEYGVTIAEIQRLNNLVDEEVYPNQQLLVQKSATQPAPTASPTPSPTLRATALTPTPTSTATPVPQVQEESVARGPGLNPTLVIFFGLVILIPGGLAVLAFAQSRGQKTEDQESRGDPDGRPGSETW